MGDETIVRLDRSDVIDTSQMRAVIFTVGTETARQNDAMPEEMAAAIGRLVMGQAVPASELHKWRISAMRIYTMDELAEEGPPISNVGPLRPLSRRGRHLRVVDDATTL